MLTRRELLAAAGAATVTSAFSSPGARLAIAGGQPGSAPSTARRLGGAPTAFSQRIRAARGGGPPFDLVEHCHSLGLAGVQTNPPSRDPADIKAFRRRLDAYGMYLVCDPRLPAEAVDVAAFDAEVAAYREAGAVMFHAAMTGRRYEDFDAMEPWKRMFDRCRTSVALAEPVLRRHGIKLGIENHKGWRAAEQAAWLRQLGSEWVGVCFDFGNNLSLCEAPEETLRTLAPYTCLAHLKDMALEEYEEGFLLSEVPLGEGLLDLPRTVQVLRQSNPDVIFELEMITRDPLKIPVLTPKYWATFDDAVSPLPARDLAMVLGLVKTHRPEGPLPRVTGLGMDAAVALEDDFNQRSIEYARRTLGL